MIEFEDVRIAYKDKPVLDGVSLTIHDREFFVLIGSSGCGKTTLLKSINKLLPLRGGSLSIDGIPVEQIKVQDLPKKVGYVVQSDEYCQDGFSNETVNTLRTSRIDRDFRAKMA